MAAPYAVRGRTAATAATAGHVIAQLWNVSASHRIVVTEIGLFKTAAGAAGDAIQIQRSTARGATPGSTATPGAANAYENDAAPPSGFVLELAAFTAQPTLATPGLKGWVAAAVAASGIVFPFPRELNVPPGTGICIVQVAATAWPVSEVWFEVGD